MTETLEGLEAAPEPQAGAKPHTGTDYVVLELVPSSREGDTWRQVREVVANSSDTAIRIHADQTKEPGVFVAVPARSFQRREVKTETTTLVKLV